MTSVSFTLGNEWQIYTLGGCTVSPWPPRRLPRARAPPSTAEEALPPLLCHGKPCPKALLVLKSKKKKKLKFTITILPKNVFCFLHYNALTIDNTKK